MEKPGYHCATVTSESWKRQILASGLASFCVVFAADSRELSNHDCQF